MQIRMLQAVGDYAKGAIVTVEKSVGDPYVAAGIAQQVADPIDEFTTKLGGAIETFSKGIDAVADKATKAFSNIKIEPGEQEADRTKSLDDMLKQVTIAGCPSLYPGMQAAAHERLTTVYASKKMEWAKKDLSETSGTAGGYTVAPMYGQELLKLAWQMSIVRPLANVKTLPARDAYFPMLNQTFTPSSTLYSPQSAYYGGVQMYWGGENSAIPSTEPNFKQVHIATNPLYGLTGVSRLLLADSFLPLEGELRGLFAGAISFAEDYAFLRGNAVDQPLGVLNSPAALSVSRTTSNQFKLNDAAALMAKMMPQSQPTSVWVLTNQLFQYLVQLVDGSGRVTYVNNVGTGYNDARLATGNLLLFGRPVFFTEKLPAVGSAGDAMLCDFSKYIVANTGTLEIAASDQYAFNKNQIVFRTLSRIDGQPQIDAPFTQVDGTSQISPFCYLAA